mgnify:CR=1 FL=1
MKSFYIEIEIRNNNKIKPITVSELPAIATSVNDIIETHFETVLMYIGIIITSTFSTTCLPKEHTLVEQLIDICSSLSYLNQSRKHITYDGRTYMYLICTCLLSLNLLLTKLPDKFDLVNEIINLLIIEGYKRYYTESCLFSFNFYSFLDCSQRKKKFNFLMI